MKMYNKVGQTKFKIGGLTGLVTLASNPGDRRIAASGDHKRFLVGLGAKHLDSGYIGIVGLTQNTLNTVMRRMADG